MGKMPLLLSLTCYKYNLEDGEEYRMKLVVVKRERISCVVTSRTVTVFVAYNKTLCGVGDGGEGGLGGVQLSVVL